MLFVVLLRKADKVIKQQQQSFNCEVMMVASLFICHFQHIRDKGHQVTKYEHNFIKDFVYVYVKYLCYCYSQCITNTLFIPYRT